MLSRNVCLLFPLALLAACSAREGAAPHESAAPVSAEQVMAAADSVSFQSDIADINSGSRKVIRTADFRCRVTDVFTATSSLERMVKSVGGIVQESKMDNTSDYTQNVYHSADSIKQVHTYSTTARLSLRVPGAMLDSVINAIPQLSEFIVQRNVQQNDVTLQYLSNALKNKVTSNDEKAMNLASKSKDAIQSDEYSGNKQVQKIDRSIQNLKLLDDAHYANLQVEFFQPERVATQVVMNPEYYSKPSFGKRFLLALNNGWSIVREIFVVLVTIWPVIIIGVVLGIVLRKQLKRRRLFPTR